MPISRKVSLQFVLLFDVVFSTWHWLYAEIMYPAGKHPLYPYSPEDKQYVLKESGFKEHQLKEDVETMMKWFQKLPHLAEAGIRREMIEIMLIASKGSLETTKKRIECYYTFRGMAPELIQARINLLNDNTSDLWQAYAIAPTPKLYNGKRITVAKVANPDKDFESTDILITLLTFGDIRVVNDYMLGDIWIIDLEHFTLNSLMKLNWFAMNKTFKIAKEGLGLRLFAIHILNCNIGSLVQFLLNMMKPILSEKIYNRVVFHQSVEDLYKYVPKEYLPKEYGGDCPSTVALRDKYDRLLRSPDTKQLLIDSCKMVSDESLRPKDDECEEYLYGTFKKLDLD